MDNGSFYFTFFMLNISLMKEFVIPRKYYFIIDVCFNSVPGYFFDLADSRIVKIPIIGFSIDLAIG